MKRRQRVKRKVKEDKTNLIFKTWILLVLFCIAFAEAYR